MYKLSVYAYYDLYSGNNIKASRIVSQIWKDEEPVNDNQYDRINIDALKSRFDKDWSNLDVALKLFSAYVSVNYNSEYKYRQAAIVIIKNYIETFNLEEKPVLTQEQYDFINSYYENLKIQLDKYPNNADILALISSISLLAGSVDESYEYAKRAYEINPVLYSAVYANISSLKGNFKEAYSLLNETIRYMPLDYDSRLKKAEICLVLGKIDETVEICKSLVSLNKKKLDAISLLYYCLEKKGASDSEIIKAIAPEDVNQPYEKVYTKIAAMLITQSSHIGNGRSMTERAIKINPGDTNIYLKIADAYRQINKFDAANDLLNRMENLRK